VLALAQTSRKACLRDAGVRRAAEAEINAMLQLANCRFRAGEALRRPHRRAVRPRSHVGYMHMLKRTPGGRQDARALDGPYSSYAAAARGKAQFGGQRFGEMECGRWRPTAPVRAGDADGEVRRHHRPTKVYENIVKGDHKIDAGMPESFNVLVKEIVPLASTSIWRVLNESTPELFKQVQQDEEFDAIKIGLASPGRSARGPTAR